MTNKEIKNTNKQIADRIQACGEAVANIYEVAINTSGSIRLIEFLDEMYLTLMASESYLAQDNQKRREATFYYQVLREDFGRLEAVEW